MKKLDKKGAILGVVLIFMLVLTILGYGLLQLSYVNAIQADRFVRSNKAFWAAEAGVERVASNLPSVNPITGTLNNGSSYSVTVNSVAGFFHRWNVESTGTAGSVSRKIKVTIGPNVEGILLGKQDVSTGGSSSVTGNIYDHVSFSFDDVFGNTKDEIKNNATNLYNNASNNKTPVNNITWFEGDFKITNNSWSGSGLMVVNGKLDISGGSFSGIIWVTGTGTLKITGNSFALNGAIFAEGDIDVLGDPNLNYDAASIDQVVNIVNSTDPPLALIAWQEVPAT